MVFIGPSREHGKDYTIPPFGPARSQHLPHDRYFQKDGKHLYAMYSESMAYARARPNYVQLGPDSLPPGIFSSDGTFFDIRLTGAGVHTLQNLTLRMEITKTGTAADLTVPVPPAAPTDRTEWNSYHGVLVPQITSYFFNRIEVQPDGGEVQDTIYPDQLAMDVWQTLSSDTKASIGFAAGINTSAAGPTVYGQPGLRATYDEDAYPILPGETKEFFIPLINMLTQAQLFLPAKRQDPRLRFYMARQPVCSDSAPTAVMTLVGADCILGGIIYENDVLASMKSHYTSIPTISRVLVHERQILDVKAATALNQLNDLSLTVFNGSYADLKVYLQDGSAQQEQRYASNRTLPQSPIDPVTTAVPAPFLDNSYWLPLARLSITDSAGNPVWYNLIPGKYVKHIQAGMNFPHSYIYSEKNIYPFLFSSDIARTLETGANCGGISLDSNFQLQIVPGPFFDRGADSFSIRVNALRYALLRMDSEGKFSVVKT